MKYPAFILILTLSCVESISFEKKTEFSEKEILNEIKKNIKEKN